MINKSNEINTYLRNLQRLVLVSVVGHVVVNVIDSGVGIGNV